MLHEILILEVFESHFKLSPFEQIFPGTIGDKEDQQKAVDFKVTRNELQMSVLAMSC